jgi:RNA polymerase sigma factor (sigma-70 family)
VEAIMGRLLELAGAAAAGAAKLCYVSTSRSAGPARLPVMTAKPPFEAVVTEHGATILRVCRAILGSADAEDAWSETFLAALKAYSALPGDANIEAWLVTIAHRKAIDVTRAAARRPVPVADLPERASAAGQAAGQPGAPAADARDLDLAAAVNALPRRQREAVAYHYLTGLPYADVAAVIGGTAEAARRAAADGIAGLRRTYPGATPEPAAAAGTAGTDGGEDR